MESSDKLYDELIRPIEQQMIRIVGRVVRDNDEAEDVFQEILAVIWARLDQIEFIQSNNNYFIAVFIIILVLKCLNCLIN